MTGFPRRSLSGADSYWCRSSWTWHSRDRPCHPVLSSEGEWLYTSAYYKHLEIDVDLVFSVRFVILITQLRLRASVADLRQKLGVYFGLFIQGSLVTPGCVIFVIENVYLYLLVFFTFLSNVFLLWIIKLFFWRLFAIQSVCNSAVPIGVCLCGKLLNWWCNKLLNWLWPVPATFARSIDTDKWWIPCFIIDHCLGLNTAVTCPSTMIHSDYSTAASVQRCRVLGLQSGPNTVTYAYCQSAAYVWVNCAELKPLSSENRPNSLPTHSGPKMKPEIP